jgi:hypothetical protein
MPDIFDLVIYGSGIHAASLLAESQDKGLKVALVSENDFIEKHKNDILSPHQHVHQGIPIFGLKLKYPFNLLKKAAPHLIVHSKTLNYKPVNANHKVLVGFYKLFQKINTKITGKITIQNLKSSDTKFSIQSLSILLTKFAVDNGACLFQFSSLTSSQFKGKKYFLNFYDKMNGKDFTLKSKSVLIHQSAISENELQKKRKKGKSQIAYFSYPSSQLDLKNNIILDHKEYKIHIIPWFDFTFFSIYSDCKVNQTDAVNFINTNVKFLNLKENLIRNYTHADYNHTKSENCYTFFLAEKQKQYHYKYPGDNFKFAFNTISEIVKRLKSRQKTRSLLYHTILPGGDLGIAYHPLRIMELADKKYDLAKHIMKSPLQFKKLFYRYGNATDCIIEKAYEYRNQLKDNDLAWLKAEAWYCIHFEMCVTTESFINSYTSLWMEGNSRKIQHLEQFFKEIRSEN